MATVVGPSLRLSNEPTGNPHEYKPTSKEILTKMLNIARAYVWMHEECSSRLIIVSNCVMGFQCIASCVSGSLVLTGNEYCVYSAIGLSFLVALITWLSKLKTTNFDCVSEQHASCAKFWNNFIATINSEMNDVDNTKHYTTQFSNLENVSNNILPKWVRRSCASKWQKSDSHDIPVICNAIYINT
jgi:hypothetical protein